MTNSENSMINPYRVLDLAGEQGLICGKILGELGADVIKVERPGGDAARRLGPFYHDEPHPERSLFWFALNTSKRGITLDVETADGQAIFRKLAEKADIVVETFSPGHLDSLGLGYSELEKINPGTILVSITPFGQYGPYKDYKTSDIVAWATGGNMAPWGDPDRPPVHFSHHSQAYLHAGADGAIGALTAIYHRWQTGEGQHVDVSIQESVVHTLEHITSGWDLRQTFQKRNEELRMGAAHRTTQIWPCKDGWVSWSHGGKSVLSPSLPLIKWMDEEGYTNDFIKNFDWERPDFIKIPQEEMDQVEEPTGRFFLAHTKAELLEGAVERKVMLYPVSDPADMMDNAQLKDRDFWVQVEHPELGESITYPGAFTHTTEVPPRISRRAPLIGEHNDDIYMGELGLSREELTVLKEAGVI